MNVIVTGTLGYDYIMDFPGKFADRIMPDKIHQISLSFLVDTLHKNFGGTAGNIAYTLKMLGLEPLILSSAGNDFSEYKTHLKRHRILTNHIYERKDVTTGAYFVVTDQEDNQIGAFYRGAIKYTKQLSIQKLSESHLQEDPSQRASYVVISPTDPNAMCQYVKECRKLQLTYLFDPAFQIGNLSARELYEGVSGADMLIGNDYEIALIEKKLKISHKELTALTPIIITTLGSRGSVIESNSKSSTHKLRGSREEVLKIKPAKPRNTSDPTGAGDAYRSGFIAGYLRGFDLTACGQMGSVAAVYTVEKYGTQTHSFTISQFKKRYRENYGVDIRLE